MAWTYWHSTIPDAPASHRHVIFMTKLVKEDLGKGKVHRTRYIMDFFGETPEAAQAKVNEFWKAEREKAVSGAVRAVRVQEAKAAKSLCAVSGGEVRT